MMTLCKRVLDCLTGKTLATAESCTGGLIGSFLTSVSGSSAVYKGGIISYCNEIKHSALGVPADLLDQYGAVSEQVAKAMAQGAREKLQADVAVSVTGLAGPEGDGSGNPVGTVYIGYSDSNNCLVKKFLFTGNREKVRLSAAEQALKLILDMHA